MKAASLVCTLALGATALMSQTITGSIVGSVKDPSGLAVGGAEIRVVQAATGVTRQAQSNNEHGDFSLPSLPPGEYSLMVKAPGFKSLEQKSLKLSASGTLPVGELVLEVGSVTETVNRHRHRARRRSADGEQ